MENEALNNDGTGKAPIQSSVGEYELDVSRIRQEIENGFISVQQHESGVLQILNYSQKTQLDWRWNNETMICRGLIVDEHFNIVSRPFPKFFSFEQLNGVVPAEPFDAFDKMDGSLGILYWFQDKPAIATRGSFDSPQAKFATTMLRSKYGDVKFDPLVTYLFEIIYPENRIVVDYGDREELVLLARIQTATGQELELPESFPMPIVERFDGLTDIDQITSQQGSNREGFVCRFESGLRVKFKFEEYKRLHKLLVGVGVKHVWEILREGGSLDELVEQVPDEFHQWVRETENDLLAAYAAIEAQARSDMQFGNDRRMLAKLFKRCKYPAVMFAILDRKCYADIIWKMIKPSSQTVFKIESSSQNAAKDEVGDASGNN